MEKNERINKLQTLKTAVEKVKTQHATLTGSLENYKSSLKEFGVTSVKEAEEKVQILQNELDAINTMIDAKIPDIENTLKGWL